MFFKIIIFMVKDTEMKNLPFYGTQCRGIRVLNTHVRFPPPPPQRGII
jgi:hypothetical protein